MTHDHQALVIALIGWNSHTHTFGRNVLERTRRAERYEKKLGVNTEPSRTYRHEKQLHILQPRLDEQEATKRQHTFIKPTKRLRKHRI